MDTDAPPEESMSERGVLGQPDGAGTSARGAVSVNTDGSSSTSQRQRVAGRAPAPTGKKPVTRRPPGYGEGDYGCEHYRRRCKLVTPCCEEVFWCRHCHNEPKNVQETDPLKRHELHRPEVRELICAVCNERQPVSESCLYCAVDFGVYTCLKCNFFDDDSSKEQFHCDECGICRVGGRENFFHCSTCGCCYSVALRDSHTCIQNSMGSDCPVCLEYLFDSIKPIAVLMCGHTIHEACLHQLRLNSEPGHHTSYTCPMCSKSIYDMTDVWRELDENVAANPMSQEYRDRVVKIYCKDCQSTSDVRPVPIT